MKMLLFTINTITFYYKMEDTIIVKGRKFKKYIPNSTIQKKIKHTASFINSDYKESDGLYVIGILTGAFMMTTDLVKQLTNCKNVSFMKVSSYSGTESTGNVKVELDVGYDIEGKDILLVEDIVDTGLTMEKICELLRARKPKSINICTMLLKSSVFGNHKEKYKNYPKDGVKYVAIEIENKFVIGYGLDLDGEAREREDLYVLDDN